MKHRGYTLIEVLVVAGIAVLLGSLILANPGSGRRTSDLRQAAQLLSLDLRRAQAFAISAREEGLCSQYNIVPYYGVNVRRNTGNEGVYKLFADCNRNTRFNGLKDITLEEITLKNVVIFETVPSPASNWLSIVYVPPNPDVVIKDNKNNSSFALQLCHIDDGNLCISVEGNNKGNIEIIE